MNRRRYGESMRERWKRGEALHDWIVAENATAYALAAKDPDSLDRFYQEHHEIENAVRECKSLHQETGESISDDDAAALAKRIKRLHLSHSFDGKAAVEALKRNGLPEDLIERTKTLPGKPFEYAETFAKHAGCRPRELAKGFQGFRRLPGR